MHKRIIELIVCPECKSSLQLESLKSDASQNIIEGVLTCDNCQRTYPVIEAIPRLLPDNLKGDLLNYHRDFFQKYQSIVGAINQGKSSDRTLLLKQKTLKSFSFQWNTFGDIYLEYTQHRKDYLPDSLEDNYFKKKLGLDAGCGFGRHIVQVAQLGAEMIGMDLSEAVKAAYANTKHLENVHIIQGDIYNPPFKQGTFDFIYSNGVLHHLPDPEGGFASLVCLLNSQQDIYIWCYDNEKPRKNAAYETLRRYTTRMGYKTLYDITFLAAVAVRVLINYPVKLLKGLGLKNKKFPYDYYIKYPFRVLHADLFDVFSVPSTKYYDKQELERWFLNSKLKIKEVKHAVSGWTILGEK